MAILCQEFFQILGNKTDIIAILVEITIQMGERDNAIINKLCGVLNGDICQGKKNMQMEEERESYKTYYTCKRITYIPPLFFDIIINPKAEMNLEMLFLVFQSVYIFIVETIFFYNIYLDWTHPKMTLEDVCEVPVFQQGM